MTVVYFRSYSDISRGLAQQIVLQQDRSCYLNTVKSPGFLNVTPHQASCNLSLQAFTLPSRRWPWEMAPGRSSAVHNETAKRNPRPNRGSSTASRLFERNSPPIRATFCRYQCPCRTFSVIAVVSISMTACQTTSSCARSLILIGPLSVDCLRGEVQWPRELCFLSVQGTTHQYFMSASRNEQAYFIRYNEQEISSEGHLFCRYVGPESITKARLLPLFARVSILIPGHDPAAYCNVFVYSEFVDFIRSGFD